MFAKDKDDRKGRIVMAPYLYFLILALYLFILLNSWIAEIWVFGLERLYTTNTSLITIHSSIHRKKRTKIHNVDSFLNMIQLCLQSKRWEIVRLFDREFDETEMQAFINLGNNVGSVRILSK